MGFLLILLFVTLHQCESILVKHHGKKHGAGGMFFNAIVCLFAAVFFVLKGMGSFFFPKEIFIYGIISCMLFSLGFYSTYAALKIGSFVATALVGSFSGVVSVLYGILFLKESAEPIRILAIVLVFVSVVLMQYRPKNPDEKVKFSIKWLIWSLLAAVSNGFIGVVSRMQQLYFDNRCDNEFMIISFVGAFLSLMIFGFFAEKGNIRKAFKTGFISGMLAGLINGAKNFVGLLVYLFMPISVFNPIRTGISFIASFAISLALYKEKFTGLQILSVVIGVIALLMFSI